MSLLNMKFNEDTMYEQLLRNYQRTLTSFVGPTEVFVCGDTQQLKDYSKTDWPWFFNAEERYERHEKIFPKEREAAFEKGKELKRNVGFISKDDVETFIGE